MKYNVILLDVDGVLNNIETAVTFNGYPFVDGYLINRLKKIIDETGAVVVLISTWNRGYWHKEYEEEFKALYEELSKYRVFIYGCTKFIYDRQFPDIEEDLFEWLNENSDIINQFVIIDDDISHYKFSTTEIVEKSPLFNHLVIPNSNFGLSEEDVLNAISILKGERICGCT